MIVGAGDSVGNSEGDGDGAAVSVGAGEIVGGQSIGAWTPRTRCEVQSNVERNNRPVRLFISGLCSF